ncbi:MAG: segregation/condensation protein A [Brevinematia bacterium]
MQPEQLIEIEMNVKIDEFEGPLGLLFCLIVKNKLDITKISLLKIVDQFLEFSEFHKPDLKTSAEFVRIASILVYLKASALSNNLEHTSKEIEEETENLLSQLKVIKKFREAGVFLKMKRKERKMMFSKLTKRNIARTRQYSVDDIVRLAVKYFINTQRDRKFQLKKYEVSVSSKIEEIKKLLEIRHSFNFSELVISQPIAQVIASFMAILETTKSEITSLEQKRNFSDILVLRRNGVKVL